MKDLIALLFLAAAWIFVRNAGSLGREAKTDERHQAERAIR